MEPSEPKFKAVFIGGNRNGQTIEIDEPYPFFVDVNERQPQEGKPEQVHTRYNLVSNGPPLRYELMN